jgi:L-2,4-diaminobutyrate decarboxylase
MLARLVDAERIIRKLVSSQQDLVVVNPDDHGFVTLYRAYPKATDAQTTYRAEFEGEIDDLLEEHNRRIYELAAEISRRQREEGGPFLSFTTIHRVNRNGKSIVALRIFPMTPYAGTDAMHEIVAGMLAAKRNIDRNRQR